MSDLALFIINNLTVNIFRRVIESNMSFCKRPRSTPVRISIEGNIGKLKHIFTNRKMKARNATFFKTYIRDLIIPLVTIAISSRGLTQSLFFWFLPFVSYLSGQTRFGEVRTFLQFGCTMSLI